MANNQTEPKESCAKIVVDVTNLKLKNICEAKKKCEAKEKNKICYERRSVHFIHRW